MSERTTQRLALQLAREWLTENVTDCAVSNLSDKGVENVVELNYPGWHRFKRDHAQETRGDWKDAIRDHWPALLFAALLATGAGYYLYDSRVDTSLPKGCTEKLAERVLRSDERSTRREDDCASAYLERKRAEDEADHRRLEREDTCNPLAGQC